MPEPGDGRTAAGAGDEAVELAFNGVLNGEDRSAYLRPPMSPEAFAAAVGGQQPEPPAELHALATHLDAEKLEEAGWGVVWAPGLDPAVREALAPLLELRRRQTGPLFREVAFRAGETYLQFLVRYGASVNPVDPRKMPYYLLLVGDPTEIPFELQVQLDVAHAVGRLAFATAEEYARYAAGVVAAERDEISLPRRLGLWSVQNDDDRATLSANADLTRPVAEIFDRDGAGWGLDAAFGREATKARLAALLGGEAKPAVLLTASHGLMFRIGDPLQATDQGALLCAEWPGPKKWIGRIPPDHYLAARDLGDGADPSGLIAFQFACFSAGTPRLDSFSRAEGSAVPRLAERDMLAPLAQRLLGKRGGTALAVVGHVDQAWEASYIWPGAGRQLETFESTFKAILAGRRIGHALEAFALRHATIASLLTEEMERWRRETGRRPEGATDARARAFLWLAHNDARGYLLLGDPAVRAAVDSAGRG